jgi:hypothetical protein
MKISLLIISIFLFCFVLLSYGGDEIKMFSERSERRGNSCVVEGTYYENKLTEYEIYTGNFCVFPGWVACKIDIVLYEIQLSDKSQRIIAQGSCWNLE